MAGIRTRVKKKKDIKLDTGILHIQTTRSNTLVTLTDLQGNKIFGGGSWLLGFKWAKKSTPYAGEVLAKQILHSACELGLKSLHVIVKGIGMARDGVFKAVNEIGTVDILSIKENTPIQFGGCKRKRPKRN